MRMPLTSIPCIRYNRGTVTSLEKQLIIIPGLGDRVGLYRLAALIWKLRGYKVHIFSFGWEDKEEDFSAAIKRLVAYINNLHATRVNIIGVSAGGTAAVNALTLLPHKINKVITVATPYKQLSHLENTKLKTSIDRMIQTKISDLSSRILSMHGLYDQTVPVEASKPEGIRTRRVYAVNHGCIVITSLTLYAAAIRRSLGIQSLD